MSVHNIYNVLNLCGWAYVNHATLFTHSDNYVELLRVVSTIQYLAIMEPIFVVFGVAKGSLVLTTIQLMSRLIFPCWFFLFYIQDLELNGAIYTMCIAWSLAEVVRSLYYITRYRVFGLLRYNCFIVLYPLGVFGELSYIWTIMRMTSDVYVRVLYNLLCVLYVIFFPILYYHMFSQRTKYISSLKGSR